VSQLAVDNVRLVDWDQPGCDYLRAGGPVRQAALAPLAPAAAGFPVTATTLPVTRPRTLPVPPPEHGDD
jgi:hypothetical protein